MGGRCRNAGCQQDLQLDKPGGAAIPIPERVNPGEVEMRDNGFDDGIHGLHSRRSLEVLARQPVAIPLQQITAVLGRSAAIHIAHEDRVVAQLAGHFFPLRRKLLQHPPVQLAEALRRQARISLGQ